MLLEDIKTLRNSTKECMKIDESVKGLYHKGRLDAVAYIVGLFRSDFQKIPDG